MASLTYDALVHPRMFMREMRAVGTLREYRREFGKVSLRVGLPTDESGIKLWLFDGQKDKLAQYYALPNRDSYLFFMHSLESVVKGAPAEQVKGSDALVNYFEAQLHIMKVGLASFIRRNGVWGEEEP